MKKFILACDEARHYCDKTQYNESTFWEKLKLTTHLLHCKVCKEHSKNNSKLTGLLKKEKLTPSEKENLQSVLEKELTKHNN